MASCDVDTGANITVVSAKRLTFGKGELLESHTWSSDDQVFVVAGCKVYLFQVCVWDNFSFDKYMVSP